jgi:hypothetical protein
MISGHVAAVRCGLVVRLQVRAIRARTSILSVAPYASDVLVSDTWWSEGGHRLGLLDSRKRDGAAGGWVIVPGGKYHVVISTVSRPERTAGSASASCR